MSTHERWINRIQHPHVHPQPPNSIWRISGNHLKATTPTLAVRSELGSFSTYISGISRLTNYMAYICSPWAPPLVTKAIMVIKPYPPNQSSHGGTTRGECWNHSMKHQTTFYPPIPLENTKEDLKGQYHRWWIQQLIYEFFTLLPCHLFI